MMSGQENNFFRKIGNWQSEIGNLKIRPAALTHQP
jgi:hypothetical protein